MITIIIQEHIMKTLKSDDKTMTSA